MWPALDDVSAGAKYRYILEWAYSAGIVTGYDDTFFGAYVSIQRAQLAAMLYRAAKVAGEDVSCAEDALHGYADADAIATWAREAVGWAVERGYLSGDNEGNINAAGQVTRAEFAYLLMLLYENHYFEEELKDGTE